MGAIQQQGKASKLAPLQPPGPAGRRQTPLDGLGGNGPPQSVQGFGHRHRHRRVAALQVACQAQARAPLRFCGQGLHPAQAAVPALRFLAQHLGHLGGLGAADGHPGPGHHCGLFAGNGRQVVPQQIAMVHADGPEADHRPLRVGRGGIQPSPHSHLQHHQGQPLGRKAIEGGGGQQLEGGEAMALADGLPAAQISAQGVWVDPGGFKLDAFAPANQVGRAIDAAAPARRQQDAMQLGGDRTFAIGACHLNGGKTPFGMATVGQGCLHPIQTQLDATAGERLQQVIQVNRGWKRTRGQGWLSQTERLRLAPSGLPGPAPASRPFHGDGSIRSPGVARSARRGARRAPAAAPGR